jgi:hypothetical protein
LKCPDACGIHLPPLRTAAIAELAGNDERAAWEAAGAGAAEEAWADERAAAFEAAVAQCGAASDARLAAVARAAAYDSMSKSEHHLRAALLPCGKLKVSEMNVTGAPPFEMYPKSCAFGNCPNKLWRGRAACGWDRQFGAGCPIDVGDQPFTMQRWEQKLRGKRVDDEGEVKLSYSLELLPHVTTGRAFYAEMKTFVSETWLSHDWRATWTAQAHRVYEDKKSGAPRDAAVAARDSASATATRAAADARSAACSARLLISVAPILAKHAIYFGEVGADIVGGGATVTAGAFGFLAGTVAALTRAAAADAADLAAVAQAAAHTMGECKRAACIATEVQAVLARSASVQSDYAAQLETQRSRTATCATRERHNLLVAVVGYKPYRVWAEKVLPVI